MKKGKKGNRKQDSRFAIPGRAMFRDLSIPIPPELDLAAGAPFVGREQPATMKIPEDISELLKPLVEMATNAWRLKKRMVDPETGEVLEETQRLYRFVEGLYEALAQAGIEIIEKTGKPYNDGMRERVISFEQTPGLLRDEIIETIRPAIRWKERLLFDGEIIVGIPVVETPEEPAAAADAGDTPEQAPADTPEAAAPPATEPKATEQTEGAKGADAESVAPKKDTPPAAGNPE